MIATGMTLSNFTNKAGLYVEIINFSGFYVFFTCEITWQEPHPSDWWTVQFHCQLKCVILLTASHCQVRTAENLSFKCRKIFIKSSNGISDVTLAK